MRTLGEIVDHIRNGGVVEYEELRYAVIAQDSLLTFDRMAFMKLAETERHGKKPILTRSAQWQWEEHFNRNKRAYEKNPKEWVGWNNDPDNPDFQRRRAVAINLYERASARSAQNGSGDHSES